MIGVIQNLCQIKNIFYVHCVFSSAQHTVIHTTCHVTDLVQKLESPDAGLTVPHWSNWSNIVQKLESPFQAQIEFPIPHEIVFLKEWGK